LLYQIGGTLFALWAISCRADIIHENGGKCKGVFGGFCRWAVSILFFGYWIQKRVCGTMKKEVAAVSVMERKELSFICHHANNGTASLGRLAVLCSAVIE
jgi:hypothetical protein